MDDVAIARAFHVIAVVMWIGSVYFTTVIILPLVRGGDDSTKGPEFFEKIEQRVAVQAKFTTQLTGLTGFYMLHVTDAWDQLLDLSNWWLHAMIFIYALFTLVLFVLEPLVLHRWFEKKAAADPASVLSLVFKAHILLTTLSFITIAAVIIGVHS